MCNDCGPDGVSKHIGLVVRGDIGIEQPLFIRKVVDRMDWTTALNQLKEVEEEFRSDRELWHVKSDEIVLELLHSLTRDIPDGNELADAQVFVQMYSEVTEEGWYA